MCIKTPEEAAAERVARGIQFLDDSAWPDWRSKIDLDALYLYSSNECILGQIFGTYYDGLEELEIGNGCSCCAQYEISAMDLGFNTNYSHDEHSVDYSHLDAAWRKALA